MPDLRSLWVGFDLDTGAGTERVLGASLRISADGGSIEAKGQQTMASSIPVVIASNQSAVAVDTELVSTVLADNISNPTIPWVGSFILGWDGTNWDRIAVANSGRLQVDVVTGGGADTPTNPANAYATSASLAAGSEANLDTGDLGAKKLTGFEAWATCAWRGRLFKVLDSVEDTNPTVICGGNPFEAFQWKPPHKNYVVLTSSGGTDAFRLEVTNLDDQDAADVYVTFHYED